MRKVGAKNYSQYSKDILKVTNKPVSCEVFADDVKNMIMQGKKISKWGKNVYVKVPVTNSKGVFMGKVIKSLNEYNIKLNITSVYTANQTKKILRSIKKKTKVIISIFAGRMGDAGKDPIPEFKKVLKSQKNLKTLKYFGLAQESLIIISKQNKLSVTLLLLHQK